MRSLALIVVALSLCWLLGLSGIARADAGRPVDRAASSGLGLGVGAGTENVFVGGHLIYYLQLREPRLRVALHAGAGYLPEPGDGPTEWGMTGGAFLAFGRRHRLVAGLIGGTLGWQNYVLYGELLAVRQLVGLGLCAGWEFMTRRGFFVRGDIGPAFMVQPEVALEERETHATVVGSTSIGWKLW